MVRTTCRKCTHARPTCLALLLDGLQRQPLRGRRVCAAAATPAAACRDCVPGLQPAQRARLQARTSLRRLAARPIWRGVKPLVGGRAVAHQLKVVEPGRIELELGVVVLLLLLLLLHLLHRGACCRARGAGSGAAAALSCLRALAARSCAERLPDTRRGTGGCDSVLPGAGGVGSAQLRCPSSSNVSPAWRHSWARTRCWRLRTRLPRRSARCGSDCASGLRAASP